MIFDDVCMYTVYSEGLLGRTSKPGSAAAAAPHGTLEGSARHSAAHCRSGALGDVLRAAS